MAKLLERVEGAGVVPEEIPRDPSPDINILKRMTGLESDLLATTSTLSKAI